jgi:DNA-binding IclR family transcriptional regulator
VSNERTSDVGVIDKSMLLLDALSAGDGSFSLVQLASMTGLHRATAHRLLKALEVHGLTRLDPHKTQWTLGPKLVHLGRRASAALPLRTAALPILTHLRATTEESVQLYVRQGNDRVCIASLESPHGLRTIVAVGAVYPLPLGSAGRVLAMQQVDQQAAARWVESVAEREPGVASVSAPIVEPDGRIIAAVSISGPIDRLTRSPGALFGAAVSDAAQDIERAVAR